MNTTLRPRVVLAALLLHASLLAAAPAAAQIVLTTPVALTPASPATGQSTTATFTVQNSGTAAVDIPFLVVSVRTAANVAADFPVSHEITLQPGQRFTYSGARSFATTGTYVAWPAYSDGTARLQLSETRTEFTVQAAVAESEQPSGGVTSPPSRVSAAAP
jgi:hypothetical protein